jgi:hypothetical protein
MAYNNNLKFPLDDNEIKNIDNVWNFMNKFRITELTRYKYRNKITNKIKNDYLLEEFYEFEIIAEKLYWNLAFKIKEEIDLSNQVYVKKEYDIKNIKNKILMRSQKIKRSNLRKSYVITKNKIFLYKYEYPNDFDLLIASIIQNRSLYETIMANPSLIYSIEINPYNNNIEFDYPYPNLNTIKPFSKSKKKRINNIKNLYYSGESHKNWFT